jgi:predicted dehydrogenase
MTSRRPRLGFVGLGWIGAMRLEAVAGQAGVAGTGGAGGAEVVAICDASPGRLESTARNHAGAACFQSYEDMMSRAAGLRLDGVVIATPNALHAPQALAALDRGLAVFCQQPLALDAGSARSLVDAARQAGRRLAVDDSWRFTAGARCLRELIAGGSLGRVLFLDAAFHNAFGPDKPWCFDPELSGGGALIDQGVPLIDLAFWLLGEPEVRSVVGSTGSVGSVGNGTVEDFASARIELAGGAVMSLAASWHAHAGQDCVIRSQVFGTAGGADLHNVAGSFYDFELARFDGSGTTIETRESRGWINQAVLHWVERLGVDPGFDPAVERSVAVSAVVDAVYRAVYRS